jgi:hypothetical protein
MVENRNNKRIIHAAIALLIALILIFADSASAITVKVDTTNMPTIVGQTGHFYFNVTIGGNEKIPIANFTIEDLPDISGSPGGKLLFNVSDIGTTVGNDTTKGNYDIELVHIYGWINSSGDSSGNVSNDLTEPYNGTGYGYAFSGDGFGYGYSNPDATQYTKLAYKITVDTTGATPETYNVIGKINTGNNTKPFFSTADTSPFTLAYAPPNITSYGPVNSSITNNEGATRSFNVTIDQEVNVTWMINGTAVQTNTSITTANYTKTNVEPGVWIVSANATNTNGTDIQSWTWTVIENGTISGTVTDSSAEPINNANVYARNVSTGDLIGSDQTDSTGKYYISIVPDTYTLNVGASNYAWNNDTTAVVEAGKLNSSCDVVLTSNIVTLILQSGETSSKIAVKGNATIFNLTATNYGINATFTLDNSSTNATVKFNGVPSLDLTINDSESKNFNVSIKNDTAGYYPVEITLNNDSTGKTASINLYATMRNETGNTTIGNCDSNIGNATGGAVLVNSNITSINATVIASTLQYSTISGNGTIVKESSTITHGNVTDNATVAGGSLVKYSNVTGATSEVDNGATIDNSTVDNSKVDNSTIVKVTAKSSTTITNVTIDTGHAIELTGATVTPNVNGDAQISGSTDAVVVTRNVNFKNVYSDIAIKDLIIDQSNDKTTTANSENISEINNCKLTVNFSEAALINISETGINPDGEASDVDYSDVIGNFMHIQSNNTSSANITIRLYYSSSKSYTDDIYIYYYDTSTNEWVQQTTTKEGISHGRTYIEATPNHLSTFVVMGVDDAPTPTPTATQRSSSSSRSNYWRYHGTPTPTSTEPGDTTQGQVSPTKTEGEVSTGTEQTQAAATPTETEDGGLPGFGAIMFITGLLTAAYIIMRKRG